MVDNQVENSMYKLLGFENSKSLAIIMVISTGKVLKLKLSDLLKSEIIDNLNKKDIKDVYR